MRRRRQHASKRRQILFQSGCVRPVQPVQQESPPYSVHIADSLHTLHDVHAPWGLMLIPSRATGLDTSALLWVRDF